MSVKQTDQKQEDIDQEEQAEEQAQAQEALASPSLDSIREKIFGAKPESRTIEFFGAMIELRQPPMETILEARAGAIQHAMLNMLVNYTYIPGTETKVFTPEDEDGLRSRPVGPDVQRLIEACNELMGIDTKAMQAQILEGSKST